jgi:hypothetical protein
MKRITTMFLILVAVLNSSLLVQVQGDPFTSPLPESEVQVSIYTTQTAAYTTLNWAFIITSNRNLTFSGYLNVSINCDYLLWSGYQISNATLKHDDPYMNISHYYYPGLEKIPMMQHFAMSHLVKIEIMWIDNLSRCLSWGPNISGLITIWRGGPWFYHGVNATVTYQDYGPVGPLGDVVSPYELEFTAVMIAAVFFALGLMRILSRVKKEKQEEGPGED